MAISPGGTHRIISALGTGPVCCIGIYGGRPLAASTSITRTFDAAGGSVIVTVSTLHVPHATTTHRFFGRRQPLRKDSHRVAVCHVAGSKFALLVRDVSNPNIGSVGLTCVRTFGTVDDILGTRCRQVLCGQLCRRAGVVQATARRRQLLARPGCHGALVGRFSGTARGAGTTLGLPAVAGSSIVSTLLLSLLEGTETLVDFSRGLGPRLGLLPPANGMVSRTSRGDVLDMLSTGLPTEALRSLVGAYTSGLTRGDEPWLRKTATPCSFLSCRRRELSRGPFR